MSWLSSITNSLRLDDDDDDVDDQQPQQQNHNKHTPNPETATVDPKSPTKPEPDSQSEPSTPTARGVKEDLSELKQTISRRLWGVASFLAPPSDPEPKSEPQISDPERATDEDLIAGIRSDFAEISGRFRSGISKLSENKAVSEITKIASNFLQLGSEEERSLSDYNLNGVVGFNEDVVSFARSIAMHPETWLDFPLPDDPESDDFELSDFQQEHALAVERLAPRLAALRMELCPGYMSDGCFWKIYFVLLHPRLDKNDAVILSTPPIMEARAMLTEVLDKRKKKKQEQNLSAGSSVPSEEAEHFLFVPTSAQQESNPQHMSVVQAAPSAVMFDVEMDKHVQISNVPTEKAEHGLSVPTSFQQESHPLQTSVVEAAPSVVLDAKMDKHPPAQNSTVQFKETKTHLPVHTSVQQESQPLQTSVVEAAPSAVVSDVKMDNPVQSTQVQDTKKSMVKEAPVKPSIDQSSSSSVNKISDELDEDDDWLKEDDTPEMAGLTGTSNPAANDDDVSFSDLEEDDV
ncbi:uncharacterized protein LOC107482073 [Arachis duranensis]|uniref:Uncharacterized protein LOC107482073 n=1 Tax=Arachis duranensis TaxID=130453 RepID=A0A6P4D1X0_ARADU|nr:uncharacterized protein LOC107482073 [Arachis duranensis]